MNPDPAHRDSFTSLPEPLPADFDVRQTRVDLLLARIADEDGRFHAPADLSDRLFAASVHSLPTLVSGELQRRLRPLEVESDSARVRSLWSYAIWGRFAIAATVAIAAGATVWMTWPSQTIQQPVAQERGGRLTPPVQVVALDLIDLNRFDEMYTSDIDAYESGFSYLLEASQVRSFDDLNTDLRQFVAHLEM